MEITYGGKLQIGDLIMISNGNYLQPAWYAGEGSGTLQYYWLGQPVQSYNRYQDYLKKSAEEKATHDNNYKSGYGCFSRGFTYKNIWKSYVNAPHKTRFIKVNNPEEIFTDKEDLETYLEAREILINLNIVKP